jgi:hypothetical protein
MVSVPPEPGNVKLLDRVREAGARATSGDTLMKIKAAMRLKHHSLRTERTYIDWIERFIRCLCMRHPAKMAELEKGDLFLSFARHRCRHHSRFGGNLRFAALGAEHAAIRSPENGKHSPG